jgi:hypothetical protein
MLSQVHNHEETVLKHTWSPESKRVYKGENIKARYLNQAFPRRRFLSACCPSGGPEGLYGGECSSGSIKTARFYSKVLITAETCAGVEKSCKAVVTGQFDLR